MTMEHWDCCLPIWARGICVCYYCKGQVPPQHGSMSLRFATSDWNTSPEPFFFSSLIEQLNHLTAPPPSARDALPAGTANCHRSRHQYHHPFYLRGSSEPPPRLLRITEAFQIRIDCQTLIVVCLNYIATPYPDPLPQESTSADGGRTRANFTTGRATVSPGLVTLPTNLPKRNEVFPSRAKQAYCCWDWVCDRVWGSQPSEACEPCHNIPKGKVPTSRLPTDFRRKAFLLPDRTKVT
jgi:hypothetical protein